jgi:YD repeat-containing protein
VSPLYSTASDACTQGFAAVQSAISGWAGASASYDGVTCTISTSAGVIGTLRVYSTAITAGGSSSPLSEYDVIREDGQTLRYPVIGGVVSNPPGISLRLSVTGSGFTLTDDRDNVETYNANGVLLSIAGRGGVTQTLSYDSSGLLSAIADSFGNTLTISRDAQARISSVAATGGASVQFGYGLNQTLTGVTHADGTKSIYGYGNSSYPTALTSLVDENGAQFSSWTYDTQGRASSTQEAGGADATSMAYNADGSVTTTDAFGTARTFAYTRVGDISRPISISGSQCPTCQEMAATSYDANGWVASRTDYNGNLTCYANDPTRGLELTRVEGFASGSTCPTNLVAYTPTAGTRQRKIATVWDANFREPDSITEANRTRSFTYDTSGNALTKTVTDTSVTPNMARTWTYTYDSYGRVLTSDGPRTDVSDVTTYAYYTLHDRISMRTTADRHERRRPGDDLQHL